MVAKKAKLCQTQHMHRPQEGLRVQTVGGFQCNVPIGYHAMIQRSPCKIVVLKVEKVSEHLLEAPTQTDTRDFSLCPCQHELAAH